MSYQLCQILNSKFQSARSTILHQLLGFYEYEENRLSEELTWISRIEGLRRGLAEGAGGAAGAGRAHIVVHRAAVRQRRRRRSLLTTEHHIVQLCSPGTF